MSLKAELETWASALAAYDEKKFDEALEQFSRIADNSKILTNVGLIYATLGDHEAAVEQFAAATQLDQYLAIAHFQCGVSNFLLGNFDYARQNFEEAFLRLRDNQSINYEQLGLKFKLYSCEVLFNRGLCMIYLGRIEEGMREMEEARKNKATQDHYVIDEALIDRGQGYTVFSIPVGILYRPAENKIKNTKQKDYLGKAKLVATADANDAYTAFSGPARLKQDATVTEASISNVQSAYEFKRSATVGATVSQITRIAPNSTLQLKRSKSTAIIPDNGRSAVSSFSSNSMPAQTPTSITSDPGENVLIGPPPVRSMSLRKQRSTPDIQKDNALKRPPPRYKPIPIKSMPIPTESYDEYIESYRTLSAPRIARILDSPRESVGRDNMGGDSPARDTPGREAPVRDNPGLNTPGRDMPGRDMPGRDMPGRDIPGRDMPGRDMPGRDMPRRDMPGRDNPGKENPGRDMPGRDNAGRETPGRDNMGRQNGKEPPGILARSNTNFQRVHARSGSSPIFTSSSSPAIRREPTMRATGPTRRNTTKIRTIARYEEEEGYASADYDDFQEQAKIRVKVHYRGEIRGMALAANMVFEDFMDMLSLKFGVASYGLDVKFKDEDDGKVSLRDEMDFEMAIVTAKETSKNSSEGKLEIWCTDI